MISIQKSKTQSKGRNKNRVKCLGYNALIIFIPIGFLFSTLLGAHFQGQVSHEAEVDLDDNIFFNNDDIDSIQISENMTEYGMVNSKADNDDEYRVAWLMSFPNSGTTYTIRFVKVSTGKRVGTNYHKEAKKVGKLPIFDDQPEGPYWGTLNDLPGAGEHVLVKTHCGGYHTLDTRGIDRTSEGRFIWECAMASFSDDISKAYPLKRVKKTVHLIRDPFSNIVARFHNRFKDPSIGGEKNFGYRNTKEGFRQFCEKYQQSYQRAQQQFLTEHQATLVKDVPCAVEFILYVQWHNNAFKTTKVMGIDVMVLHYESFETRFDETTDNLLSFLGYQNSQRKYKFESGKTYSEYFRPKERQKVKEVLRELASTETWAEIKDYF